MKTIERTGCEVEGCRSLTSSDGGPLCEHHARRAAVEAEMDETEEAITAAVSAAGLVLDRSYAETGTRYLSVSREQEEEDDLLLVVFRVADHDEAYAPRHDAPQYTVGAGGITVERAVEIITTLLHQTTPDGTETKGKAIT